MLIELLSSSNYVNFNIKIAQILGLKPAIYLSQIMDINEKDSLEIFTDENKIILQKYQPSCIFCNNADDIVFFNGKRVCENCLKKIKETL